MYDINVMYDDFLVRRLTSLRQKKGVSARDMSLSIGQSSGYINAIENGATLPSMRCFFYICEYLNVSPMEFFDEQSSNPPLLNELLQELRGLDSEVLKSILQIAKAVRGKK